MEIDARPNLGLDQIIHVIENMNNLYGFTTNLALSCRDVGHQKLYEDFLYLSRHLADMKLILEKSHTILVNDLVKRSDRATINMIAAAIASASPSMEDKF